jgi:type VI secretion system protein ImpA
MAAVPLLDFTALTAPISEAAPAGVPVPFDVRETLTQGRVEENPDDFKPDDPMRPATFKKAEWANIAKLAQETLAKSSKDLLVAARLTEALVKLHGFAGLRDGLHLMRLLIEQCWDRLHPVIEDGDLELRAGPFHWLDDALRGARFPHTLRTTSLVFDEGNGYSYFDWRPTSEGRPPPNRAAFDKAAATAPLEQLEALFGSMTECQTELSGLCVALNDKMASTAPGMTGLREALEQCQGLVREILARRRPAGSTESHMPLGASTIPSSGAGHMTSREDAYRQLAQAAEVLRQLEPHSPIPYLVKRAVELGALPFPELMQALIREPNAISELKRELGIKEPPKAAE